MQFQLPVWFLYAVHAAVLLASLLCFLLAKVEVARLRVDMRAEAERRRQETDRALRSAMEASVERAEAAEPQAGAGINFSRRAQILRLSKRGERPEQIAAALNLPMNEVSLVLKLHQRATAV